MTNDEGGKRRPGGGGPRSLIDPDAFWTADPEEEPTEEVATPAARPGSDMSTIAIRPDPKDEDMAIVGPADLFAGQPPRATRPRHAPTRPTARASSAVRPRKAAGASRPPVRARPAGASSAMPAKRTNVPGDQRSPASDRAADRASEGSHARLRDERAQLVKVVLLLVLVAGGSAFLGWFLIGRTADEPKIGETQQRPPVDVSLANEGQPSQAATGAEPKGPAGSRDKRAGIASVAATENPRRATLSVQSEPAGAHVFVDGEHRGMTPVILRGVAPEGGVDLRIEADGYKPWRQVITFDGKDLGREIQAGLIKIGACPTGAGFLYITTDPAGATIELNGKRLPGKTPQVVNDVCAGITQSIRLQAAGYPAWRKELVIQKDEIRNLNIKLER